MNPSESIGDLGDAVDEAFVRLHRRLTDAIRAGCATPIASDPRREEIR